MPTVKKMMPPRTTTPIPAVSPNGVADPSGWDLSKYLKVLLYGDSGTGKTTLWATFPGPILAMICSGSRRPGELKSIDTPEYRKKVRPVIIRSLEHAQEELNNATGKYGAAILDHGTGLQDLAIKEHLGLDEIPIARFRKAGKGEAWGLVPQADWGEINTVCLKVLRKLMDLDCHTVVVCQEKVFKGREEMPGDIVKPVIGGAMTPGVMQWLNPSCDCVVQTFKRPKMVLVKHTIAGKETEMWQRAPGVEYCLRTGPHDVYMTKFRVPRGHTLPECLVDPDYDKIKAVLQGEYTEEG